MPFGLHMRTPWPDITSRASVQFPVGLLAWPRTTLLHWVVHVLKVLPNFVQEVWSWDSDQEYSSCHWRSLHMQMGQVKHWCAFGVVVPGLVLRTQYQTGKVLRASVMCALVGAENNWVCFWWAMLWSKVSQNVWALRHCHFLWCNWSITLPVA